MQKKISEIYHAFLKSHTVSIDSREIFQGAIFFALKGENFDGNAYAEQALKNGASVAVIDSEKYYKEDNRYVLVENTLKALQQLALYHRKKFFIPIIGITGSNGKTTTKELVKTVLSEKFDVLATEGNLNNHIGVPLMLLRLRQQHQIAVIEMGANHVNDIAELCEIARPTHGILTNIGKAHLEGFNGLEGVIKAKNALYQFLFKNKGLAFVNKDDDLLMNLSEKLNRVFYSNQNTSECYAKIIDNKHFIKIKWELKNSAFEIGTRLYGSYNVYNVLAALCVGSFFDVNNSKMVDAIRRYEPNNNRTQLITTAQNTILLDAYNANPSSMELAINSFAQMPLKNKVLIAGDMRELGIYSEEEHRKILTLIESCSFSQVFLVGEEFTKVNDTEFLSFPNVEEFRKYLIANILKNNSVFIKGSRGIKLETIIDLL